ncbi:MAG: hypothetical protein PHQ36_04025 [Anaerolineales bacterium]|nr:hypothetical protein [Anaerolineales bacterium]
MKPTSPKTFWKIFISSAMLVSGLAIYQTAQQVSSLGVSLWRSKWIFLLGLFALNILVGAFALWKLSFAEAKSLDFAAKSGDVAVRVKALGALLILFGFSLVWIFKFSIFANTLPQIAPIFWVFLWASLVQTLGLKLIGGYKWRSAFAFIVVVQGLIYQLYGQLAVVSAYPFSIGYSEAARHYYASMFHAKSLYGLNLPYPFLHPTRYMLLSLPFLVNGLPLWAHRLWQAVLWIVLTGTSAILLTRRLKLKGWMFFFAAAWAYLYFLQGAVYYQLQVCVILILAGVDARKLRRSFIFILLASFWAGMSRVNWFPVPAMLAIAIYVLETAINNKGWRYWITPAIWGSSGFAAALAAQFFYINISGAADARDFGSSFTSALLWDRLLPNANFMGILLGIAIVAAPLIAALIQVLRGKFSNLHVLRWLALLALLLTLFVGGLAVSVKIGGGADLHNMDAFLVMLALIATSFFAERVELEDGKNIAWGQPASSVVAAALLIPLGFAIPRIASFYHYDSLAARKDIQTLQKYAEESNGEVLFVTERQLFTFGELKNIPLVADYEQIELMEMAMSGNRPALEKYYADLANHRFALIIAEDQKFTLRKTGGFLEEDNAWVRYVGAPLLCAYKPVETLATTNVQVFIPRPNKPNCKDQFR